MSESVMPPRLVDDDQSDVHMQRDLLLAAMHPGLLYRVRRGLRAFRRRLAGGARGTGGGERQPDSVPE